MTDRECALFSGEEAGSQEIPRKPANRRPYAAVVGGANMDIGGRSLAPLVAADSNPGVIHMSLGGVGRNIAHNLALLGVETQLLTVLGDDLYARRILQSCQETGICTDAVQCLPGERTSTYLYIADQRGEMAVALSDMEIYRRLTPAWLEERSALLQGAEVVVLDTNLPEDSIRWLAEHCRAPLFADPVSTAKSQRLKGVLGRLHTLKPNRLEAERLTGIPIRDEESLLAAADALLSTGLRRVFLSLGRSGVLAASREEKRVLPNLPGEARNTTGCGDAFMAALVLARLEGLGLEGAARAGLAAAAIAREGKETINPGMSRAALEERLARRS